MIADLYTRLNINPCAAPELMAAVKSTFGTITVDLAAEPENTKAPRYITPAEDSFKVDWAEVIGDGLGWLNPPPGDIEEWATKAVREAAKGAPFLMITQAHIDARWFWQLAARGAVFILTPRMLSDGLPIPQVLFVFNRRYTTRGFLLWHWQERIIQAMVV